MSRFFKVKSGTKEWELFHKLWTFEDMWRDKMSDIEKLLGCNPDKNLAVSTHTLLMKSPPEHLRDQFSKRADRDGFYKAKSRSAIQEKWTDFCKVNQLEAFSAHNLIWKLGLPSFEDMNAFKCFYPLMEGDYYFELREGRGWSGYSWAIEVDEPSFLRLKANWLEQKSERSA